MPFGMAGVLSRKQDGVGWIVVSQPERMNALSLDMWHALSDVARRLDADDDVRALALTGDGDAAFVAGADISEFEQRRTGSEASALYDGAVAGASAALLATVKPTVAVIKGVCFGGGVGLAVSCDIRIAREDAVFCIPASRLGIGYHLEGVQRLMTAVGPSAAAEILVTGRRYDAAEAAAMRLVNRVVPAPGFDAAVAELLGQIVANAPLSVAAATRAVRELTKPVDERDLDGVERLVARCFVSEDYSEGRRAFQDRRKPRFTGR